MLMMLRFFGNAVCSLVLAGVVGGCSGGGSSVGSGAGGVGGANGATGGAAVGSGGSTAGPIIDAGKGGVDTAGDGASTADTGGGRDGGACSGLFCEDFEEGQIDPAKWTTTSIGAATMTVQQKIVAHGKYAVQFHGPAAPNAADYAYLIAKNAPAALQKHNFGRAYFYTAPKPHDIDMGLIFAGTAGFPRPTYMSIANHAAGWQLGFIKLMGVPGGEVQAYPPGDIPVMTWTCLEWEFNDQPDQINVWGDGKVIGSLNKDNVAFASPAHKPGAPLFNNADMDLIGAFTDFGFGFYDWHPQGRPAFDVYYDDIVLDSKRVGCLP